MRYGPSRAYVAMAYRHDPDSALSRLSSQALSTSAGCACCCPLEPKAHESFFPVGLSSALELVEESKYLVCDLGPPLPEGKILVKLAW